MTDFSHTNWANPEFSRGYRENADIFIVERRRMLAILQSFYAHFLKNDKQIFMLDLGCGDGIITSAIVELDGLLSATLIDGSEDMLVKARERLKRFANAQYIRASFQEIIQEDILARRFDFIASSLAIHHLEMSEKAALFRKIYSYLTPNGYFVNIDVVLAPNETLEQWYLELWKKWMNEKKAALGIEGDYFADIIIRYKQLEENKPDMMEDQLNALKDTGFKDVDCYYKYGIFTMFGGRK
jgi:tRNA (cmo5U34)-methyltransferase